MRSVLASKSCFAHGAYIDVLYSSGCTFSVPSYCLNDAYSYVSWMSTAPDNRSLAHILKGKAVMQYDYVRACPFVPLLPSSCSRLPVKALEVTSNIVHLILASIIVFYQTSSYQCNSPAWLLMGGPFLHDLDIAAHCVPMMDLNFLVN